VQPDLTNAYTHAPALHPNFLFGSLQLLFWLLVHPSAWRNHIARIDPSLTSDFYLAELSQAQWRQAELRQLLIRGFVVWPLLVGLLVWLLGIAKASLILGRPQGVVGGVAVVVAVSFALGIAGGLMVSVPAGIVSGIVGSLAFSLASTRPEGFGRTAALVMAVGFALGMVGSAAYGAASAIPGSRADHRPSYSAGRQIIGIILGILIGIAGTVVASSLVISLASNVDFRTARDLVFGAAGSGTVNVARGLAFGAAGGVAVGVAVGRRTNRRRELAFGITFGVVIGVASILAVNVAPEVTGAVNAAVLTALFALCYVLAERIAGPWAGAVAGALGSGSVLFLSVIGNYGRWPILPIGVICIVAGLTLAWWRPVVWYPFVTGWNLLLYRSDRKNRQRIDQGRSVLRWHGAFWDEYQRFIFIGLVDHLLLVLNRRPAEGQVALDFLSTSSQRTAAQAAQIELDAHTLETCTDISAISRVYHKLAAGDLAGPTSALLRSFSRVSQDIESALRQESAYNQRLALTAVEERLDGLLRELTRSSEPYAERFRPITTQWRKIVTECIRELAAAVEARQEIDSPYIIGVPLTERQGIFTGRTDISTRIEQLLQDQRRPPLFLYGQRRMGKTSLLNNLGRLLPTTIVPLFVDLQGASRAKDQAGLLYSIARDMNKSAGQRRNLSLPPLSRQEVAVDPFTRFDEWLDEVEYVLADQGLNTALLALDEFETLDSAIAKGRYDEDDVLGMLRHLIQHRSSFKVLLAGSHHLDEFQRWASYLINVQFVHISYLPEAESRQLIERPVEGFPLRYQPQASRRVLDLTRGHPFLIQLLCAEIVAAKNEQAPAVRRLASLADVEAAVPEALISGSFFFADIERNQVDATGRALLRTLAACGEGSAIDAASLADKARLTDTVEVAQTIRNMLRRELIEQVDDGYRFQVELIRRWFMQN
ncbi:MAG: ATP-binding protein, partial [Anaerolineae bacterium]|nr:ATP-binding protein [Anaerolineae bacterium]